MLGLCRMADKREVKVSGQPEVPWSVHPVDDSTHKTGLTSILRDYDMASQLKDGRTAPYGRVQPRLT